MSEERLWKFRKPEWMNSAATRSAGVYAAGGLVRIALSFAILNTPGCTKELSVEYFAAVECT